MFFSFPFPGILGNDGLLFPFPNCGNGFFSLSSHSRILRIDFFISFPFPNFGNAFFIPFPFLNYGRAFFHLLPIPELWEWIFFIPFPFPNFGNRFFHSLLIPEFWECFFLMPFPFPNFWNRFFSFPSRSRVLGMGFSIPFPFPDFRIGIIHSRSHSQTPKSHSRSPLMPSTGYPQKNYPSEISREQIHILS